MTNKNKENGSLLKKLLWWIPIIILGLMFALGACTRQESENIRAESFSSAESTQNKSISDESTSKHSEEITGTQSQKKHKQKNNKSKKYKKKQKTKSGVKQRNFRRDKP